MKIELEPIAIVKNKRKEITDDFWGDVISEIELLPHIPEESLIGIETFSHIEIIFYFNKADKNMIQFTDHPRGNPEWPVMGIFGTRKKDRPNYLGLTIAEIIKRDGRKIFLKNLDAIDGTPVIDIKPVIKEFFPKTEIKQPYWVSLLMKNYWS